MITFATLLFFFLRNNITIVNPRVIKNRPNFAEALASQIKSSRNKTAWDAFTTKAVIILMRISSDHDT